MSEKDQTQESLKGTSKHLMSGEEPTELLYRLAWSPIETLLERKEVTVFVSSDSVAVIFSSATIDPNNGLLPTHKSVGSRIANTLDG